jgi:hypothetical protein
METSPVTVTFPAAPEYLRLARIATADAASRAGLDYEEIDDARIAVSELCTLLSLGSGATITLVLKCARGVLSIEGESRTGSVAIVTNDLSEAIITAVTDEHTLVTTDGVTRFQITKHARHPAS